MADRPGSVPDVLAAGIRVEHLDRAALPALVDDYRRLCEEVGTPVAGRWESVGPWLAHRPGLGVIAVALRDGRGTLTAAAVLSTRRVAFGRRVAKAGEPGERYSLPARDERHAGHLASALADRLGTLSGPWELRLDDVDPHDRVVAELARHLRPTSFGTRPDTPVLHVADREVHPLSRNTRSAVAKARNRARRDGVELRIVVRTRPEDVRAHLADVVAVRRQRDIQLGRLAPDDGLERATFTDTVLAHADAGRVRLVEARYDGRLGAFAVCVPTGSAWCVYANCVSPQFTHYSAGTVVNAAVVTAAWQDEHVALVNWGAGIQRYKLSGDTEVEASALLSAWSSRCYRALLRGRRALRRAGPGTRRSRSAPTGSG